MDAQIKCFNFSVSSFYWHNKIISKAFMIQSQLSLLKMCLRADNLIISYAERELYVNISEI